MKRIFIIFLVMGLISCSESDKDGGDSTGSDLTIRQNLSKYTWCAENDDDNDGNIGVFIFNNIGSVDWINWNLKTLTANSRSRLRWQYRKGLLQLDSQIGTQEGYKVNFQEIHPQKTRMNWTKVSGHSELNGRSTYIAVNCDIRL